MAPLLPVVAAMVMASAQGRPGEYTSGTERLVLEVPSRDAWLVVQARLKELGLAVDKIDRKNQALRTKWRPVSSGGWLPDPKLPALYIAQQIRFVVFVSPFVEPAHFSVGSQATATKVAGTRVPALVYNVDSANRALMAELHKAIVAADLPKVVREEVDPCAHPQGPTTDPSKIPLSVFEVSYPGKDLKAGTGGTVPIETLISRDGGVTKLRVLARAPGEELEAAAVGALSLLLYSPMRIGGCPTEFIVMHRVRFRMP